MKKSIQKNNALVKKYLAGSDPILFDSLDSDNDVMFYIDSPKSSIDIIGSYEINKKGKAINWGYADYFRTTNSGNPQYHFHIELKKRGNNLKKNLSHFDYVVQNDPYFTTHFAAALTTSNKDDLAWYLSELDGADRGTGIKIGDSSWNFGSKYW